MAKTNIIYRAISDNGSETTMCFICAVQLATRIDPTKSQISIESTDWEYSQCENCKEFIKDMVTI